MTNPVNPASPTPPKSGGGMPKWLILLLVIFLIILLGCCGGFAACHFMCKAAGQAIGVATQKAHDEWADATQKALADATQRAADATRQAAQGAGAPTGTPGATPETGGATPGTGGATPAGASGATPAPTIDYGANNLPTDIPVMAGMTSTGFSTVDRVHNSGGGTFTTKSSAADVSAYYQKQMASQGWTLGGNTSFGNVSILQFTKGTRTTSFTIAPDNANTNVTIAFETR